MCCCYNSGPIVPGRVVIPGGFALLLNVADYFDPATWRGSASGGVSKGTPFHFRFFYSLLGWVLDVRR